QFDVVEAVGVLHHTADALEGFRVLADRVVPGGFMRVGLYSRRARARLEYSKQFVRLKNAHPSVNELRQIRQELISTGAADEAGLTSCKDFFYSSGVRDLLCH